MATAAHSEPQARSIALPTSAVGSGWLHGGVLAALLTWVAVEANGGEVWAESLPGQGATFVIALPAERVPQAVEAQR